MKKIVLLRHGESVWNKENRFTGWTDVDLSEAGISEAVEAGRQLRKAGLTFGMAYTSYLKRAIKTLNYVLDVMDLDWIPVQKSWLLNEKHYGALQGLNKSETARKYGEEQVFLWRRSYDVAPAPLEAGDKRNPRLDVRYKELPAELVPLTESLKDTVERAVPYFNDVIVPSLERHESIIVAAHGNSLRGIVKELKGISDKDIAEFNIPTAIPYVFEFDDKYRPAKDYFIGDPEKVRMLMEKVAGQGKSK